ncbi:PKD domain-containing protein, partial [Tenacibaculum geojense]
MRKKYSQIVKLKKEYALLFFFSLFTAISTYGQTCTINAGDLNFTICEGSPFNFTGQALSPPNQTTWTQINGPSVVIEDVNDPQSAVFGMVGGNIYEFRFSANCTTDTQIVTVNVQPITQAQASDDIEYCPDNSGNVSVTGNSPQNGGETGRWIIVGANDAGVSIDFPNSETTTLTLNSNNCGTTTIAWFIEGPEYAPGLRCTSQDEVVITNYGGVQPVNAGTDQTLDNCYTTTTSTSLNATFGGCSLNGQQGVWSFVSGPNIPTFGDVNASDSSLSGLIEGTYVLRWSVGGPCADAEDEVTITVPAATQDVTDVSGSRVEYNLCDSISEITLQGDQPQFAGETVTWTMISGTGAVIQSPNSPSTLVTNLSSANDPYIFRYTLTNSNTGCSTFRDYRVRFRGSSRTISANNGDDIFGACGQTDFSIPITTTGSGSNRYRIASGPSDSPLAPFPTSYSSVGNNLNISLLEEGTYVLEFVRSEGGQLPTGCSDGFDSINITVSANTNQPNAGVDFSLSCGDTTTSLVGNVPTAGTPYWSQISGPNTVSFVDPYQVSATVNGLVPGEYVFQYDIQGGGSACATSPDTVSVFVNGSSLTTSATGPDQSVCNNAPAYMAANQPADGEIGTWTEDPGNPNPVTFSDINDPNAVITGLTAPSSSYIFTWTINYVSPGPSGCTAATPDNITVTTTATPSQTVANAGPDTCYPSGTTIFNLSGNSTVAGETGTWTVSPSAGVIFTNANDPNTQVTVPSDNTYTFTWTIDDNSATCLPTTDDVEITIADNASANAGPDQTQCASSVSMAASGSAGGTGTWTYVSGPGGFSFSDINDPSAVVSFTSNGVYVFEWTVEAGCSSDSDQVTIEVGIPPTTANAGPDQDICNATNVVMGANSFNTNSEIGSWSILSGAPNTPNIVDPSNPSTNITGLTTGTYTFRWTITSLGNPLCSESFDDVVIEVYAPATAGSDQNLCDVTSIQLQATENSTGTWTQISGPAGAVISQSPANGPTANVDISTSGVGTYEFQYTTDDYTFASGGTCIGNSDTVQIVVSGTPSYDPDAGADQDVCNADSTTVVMNGNTPPADGTTAEWVLTLAPSGNSAVITNPNSENTTITGLSTPGIYIFEWTFSNGNCVKLADVVRIEVFEAPSPVNAGADQTAACQLDFLTNATAPTHGVGVWSITSAPVGASTTIDNPNNPQTSLSNIEVGTYELTWTVSNGPFAGGSLCAPQSDTVSITFNDVPPTEAYAGPDQLLCDASDTRLQATPVSSGVGTWTLVSTTSGTTPVITAPNNPNSLILDLTPGIHEFMWTTTTTNNDGCSFSDNVVVEVVSDPITAEAGPDQTIAEFENLVLGATPATVGSSVWSQVSGPSTVGFTNQNDPNTTVTGTTVGSYIFEWTVSNGTCPPVSDQVTINILPHADLELTKSFSPATITVGDTVTFSVSIFNNNTSSTNSNASGVSVVDILPIGYTLVPASVSNGGSYDSGSNKISWSGLSIANGATLTLTYQVIVNAPTGAANEYVNNAAITG